MIANDMGSEFVFSQQVYVLGAPGDVLIGISTSGNSADIVNAFRVAGETGIRTIALTGSGGGALAPLADILLDVPAAQTFAVQELHLPLYHALAAAVEAEKWG